MRSGVNPGMVEIRSLGERPAPSALGLSLLIHCAGFLLVLLFLLIESHVGPRILPVRIEVAQLIPLRHHVSYAPKPTAAKGNGGHIGVRARASAATKNPALTLSPGEALQKEAKMYSAAIMNSLKFQEIYGFYPGHKFQLPLRQSGDVPNISADLVPPHFEQIVLIDIIIDTKGKVADARIVAGEIDPTIQQTLLTAVREFKYTPATRDDVPIPSQVEIVIHIPS